MLGSVSRFDFAQVGRNLPKVDLPDLERFLTQVMEANGRRVMWREDGLEVLVSEAWTEEGYELMPWMPTGGGIHGISSVAQPDRQAGSTGPSRKIEVVGLPLGKRSERWRQMQLVIHDFNVVIISRRRIALMRD
jgi:hypothetical protein